MKTTLCVILLGCMISPAVWAQSTAQIHGTVQDPSGAAVPGAEVRAIQVETSVFRSVASASDGGFVLTNLPLGPYRVEVSKEGFATLVSTGIVLVVGSDPVLTMTVQLGSTSQQINVVSDVLLVETRSLAVGEVIQTQRIVDLPLNGRNVTDLIGLAGASVQTGSAQTRWFSNQPIISIAGSLAVGGAGGTSLLGTEYSLDGANHLNFLSGGPMPIAFPDAVQEFRTESSGQSAERGATTSVSMVTRSGTNTFHGVLFEFFRNSGFGSAREYFSPVGSPYKRNQFGGTIGGPIKRDKLFFFGGFQGTTLRQSVPSTTIIPTAATMAGDWTTFASASCNGGTSKTLRGGTVNNLPNAAAVFAANKISPSFYTPQALYIAGAYLNNLDGLQPDGCGSVTYQVPTHENDTQYVGKIDYQLTSKQSLFFRTLESHIYYPAPLSGCKFDLATEKLSGSCVSTNMLNSTLDGENQLSQSDAIGHTYLINNHMVNSVRLAFNRTSATLASANLFTLCDAGVKIWCGGTPGQIGTSTISGGFAFGTGLGDGDFWNGHSISLNDDVSWVKGSHQMSFGVGAWQGKVDEFNHFTSPGTNILFTGQATGSGMTDFLLGNMSSYLQGLPNRYTSRQNFVDLYFTDSWKLSRRLTFNFGVRWDPFLPQQVTNGQISNFDMSRFLAGVKSSQFVNAPPGFYFPGDPGFPGQSSAYRKWWHFEPRGGFAWDPKGNARMSIRASYAFGYAYVPGIAHEDEGGSNPWGGRVTLTSPAGGLANPWQGFASGNPFPYTVSPTVAFTPAGQFMTTPYDLPSPTTYSWNLSIQKQIGSSWVASVTYLGSRVQHLYINQAINYGQIVPGPIVSSGCAPTATNCNALANVQARRVLSLLNPAAGQFIGNMDTWFPYGTQSYHGLLSSIQKTLSRGVSMSANWTWSHCIGYYQGFNSKPEETATNPADPLFDRGNCDSDRRHIVNLTAVAQMPNFSGHLAHALATGWQLAGIYRFISGAPISVQDGTDQELSGINHQRPNLVDPTHIYTGQTCGGCFYLNRAAFAPQPLGTVGNLGWNSITGPAYWGLDLALSRQFFIREKQHIEVRADAFNFTNSFVPAFSGTNPPTQGGTAAPISPVVPGFAALNSSQFGQILTAFPTRKIQFALKYMF